MIPLSWYLILSGMLFLVGLVAVLIRKNSIGILMGIELILNAANINLLAFWRYLYAQSGDHRGQMFVIVVFVVAAAEAAVGLAMIISAYRRKNTIVANDINELKGCWIELGQLSINHLAVASSAPCGLCFDRSSDQ